MIILYNASVRNPGKNHPLISALAIEGGEIIAAGSDAELLELTRNHSEKIDLQGRTVLPGLVDSHLHLKMYGEFLSQVDCETPTRRECLDRVAAKAQTTAPGEWILGHGWNQNVWPEGFGTASQLDSVAPLHPVYLTDKSIHSSWANTLAMQKAGINRDTPDPKGGSIQRDAQGNPTGILFENAVRLVESIIPAPSLAEIQKSLLAAQASLLRYGVTTVHDFDGMDCLAALTALHQAGELKLRVCKGIPLADLENALAHGMHSGWGDDTLWIGSVKCFADGALGPQTAAMLKPYEHTANAEGTLLLTSDQVFEIGMKCTTHGFSMATHAIGDKATNQVLNGYAMVREFEACKHLKAQRHRVEHLQLLHPDDLLKPRELNIIASMQPIHCTSDMFTADRHWGSRARYAYAFATLQNSGATLVFGSDAPVESPNPFLGVQAAVTRRRVDGSPSPTGWYPMEKLTVDQTLAAYTSNPAFAGGREEKFGQLLPGKKADLIVLDSDPYQENLTDYYSLSPSAVMFDGNWILRDF